MLNLPTLVESIPALQMTVLTGGIATFCAVVLLRANPLCTWFEWAGSCCDDDEADDSPDQD
ncbi:MAG TPA: hypothetical protein VF793_00535 [Telluria sp.]